MKTIIVRIRAWFVSPHILSIDLRNVVALLLVLLLVGSSWVGWLTLAKNTFLDEWLRGMYLASRLDAIVGQGNTIAIDHADSNIFEWWGMETNSKWLAEYTARILPFFEYEGIGGGDELPGGVVLFPFMGETAFTIAGRALRDVEAVLLNARYVLIPDWGDDAEILATLVHELAHLQRGNFIGDDPAVFEALTESATAEVLAAMCNYGDALACRAFATAMKGNVTSMLRRDMNQSGSDDLYQLWADLSLRHTERERDRADKVLRWWKDGRWPRLQEIMRRYGTAPLENYILPGLRGSSFNSGVWRYDDSGLFRRGSVSFDDTRLLLEKWGLLGWFLGYWVTDSL